MFGESDPNSATFGVMEYNGTYLKVVKLKLPKMPITLNITNVNVQYHKI